MSAVPDDDREARPLRADALRNRERILAAAKRVFAERGLGATLNDVAREAGVGVGTVYRRFADKDALIAALFEAKYRELSDIARAARREPTAREALRRYLIGALTLRARDRGIAALIVGSDSHDDHVREHREHRERMTAVVADLVAAARAEDAVREGFAAEDVPMLVLMLGTVADRTQSCAPEAWRRYAQLLVDAVCPDPQMAPLSGEPLDRVGIEIAFAVKPDAPRPAAVSARTAAPSAED